MEILLNLGLDIDYKQDEFFKVWLEKNFKFVFSKKNGIIVLI